MATVYQYLFTTNSSFYTRIWNINTHTEVLNYFWGKLDHNHFMKSNQHFKLNLNEGTIILLFINSNTQYNNIYFRKSFEGRAVNSASYTPQFGLYVNKDLKAGLNKTNTL